jgi:hypothetical protein
MTSIIKKLKLLNSKNDNLTIDYKINILSDGSPKILGFENMIKQIIDSITQNNEKPGATIFPLPPDIKDTYLTYIRKKLDSGKDIEMVKQDIHIILHEALSKSLLQRSINESIKKYINDNGSISQVYSTAIENDRKHLLGRYVSEYKHFFAMPLFVGIVDNDKQAEIFQKNIYNNNITHLFIDNLSESMSYLRRENTSINNERGLPDFGFGYPRVPLNLFMDNIIKTATILDERREPDGYLSPVVTFNNLVYNPFILYDPDSDFELSGGYYFNKYHKYQGKIDYLLK